MQSLIQFLKEIYLTGFAIIFNASRVRKISYKAGGATNFVAVIEWFVLLGIFGFIEIFLNIKIPLSKLTVLIAYFALFFINDYFLNVRGYGIKFAHEFEGFEKSKKKRLILSFVITGLVAIAFFIFSAIIHRRYRVA
jgi:hypothetical protein